MIHISCNTHASSFTKGGDRQEYDDVEKLAPAVGLDGEYTFNYDYPLSRIASFKHILTPDMTGEDLLVLGREDYERIYKEEHEADCDPGHAPGMLNRQRSQGPYGIWGHDICDLYFEGIDINPDSKTIEFSMGS